MAPTDSGEELRYEIEATSETSTTMVADTGTHEFVIDSSDPVEETSDGPRPEEYLLGALAGCTNDLAYEVADELDMDVSDLHVVIEGDVGGSDGEQSNTSRPGFHNVRVDLDVATDANWATIDRWLHEVKVRNPVINNLQELTPVDLSVYKDTDEHEY
jgi:uncharacterized OsmC-like protein